MEDESDEMLEEAVDVIKITDRDLPLSFMEDRHTEPIKGIESITQTWRMKERMKTVSVALVLCLNVGVDPPDIVKTQPCARLECWIDPTSLSPQKALENIGGALQKQYERWQPRARYKQSLDPTSVEVQKLCSSLRRNAKEERVLFHYNGHGVPKPTANGEIWVFNNNYTQYIPLSIYDLQTWMDAPSIYVYDCSNAGIIVESFKQFASQHESEQGQRRNSVGSGGSGGGGNGPSGHTYRNCIQLAACGSSQVLPMNPDLPADLFTACLTTPIRVALTWFVQQSTRKLVPRVTMDLVDKVPGQITDRRTMLGELNWIFTAITDTIAWNTLPRDLFQKLFRQDLLVASLFRNFLLAERILRSCDCTPVSSPALPPTYQHPMWQAWDLALDLSLGQLPRVLHYGEPFKHLPFFEEQLTAFQVWLELGSERRNPPEQLPIVLQVLLSQVHRMRALDLLGRFLDLGPWAVNLALSVGIFPYVLKLLQSSARELRPLLVFIWAKILAVDNTCQADLVRDHGHKYFLLVLQDTTISSEHRTQAAFVLACIVNEFRDGQEAAVQGSLISICLEQLGDPCPRLRQWVAICLGRLWDRYEKARWTGVRDSAHEKLYTLLEDECPEVRAAAVYALGTYINSVSERSEHANNIDHYVVMTLVRPYTAADMNPLVRHELVAALQWLVLAFEPAFLAQAAATAGNGGIRNPSIYVANNSRSERPFSDLKRVASIPSLGTPPASATRSYGSLPSGNYNTVYARTWTCLCQLERDPHPDVQFAASTVIGYIRGQLQMRIEDGGTTFTYSYSLPPSPNNRGSYLMGESPPTPGGATGSASAHDLHKLVTGKGTLGRTKKLLPNTINEEDPDSAHTTGSTGGLASGGGGSGSLHQRKPPLVSTQYLAWSCRAFTRPSSISVNVSDTNTAPDAGSNLDSPNSDGAGVSVMNTSALSTSSSSSVTGGFGSQGGFNNYGRRRNNVANTDLESGVYYEREWRYMRNIVIRTESVEQQRRATKSKLESQVFNIRCQLPPNIIQFHPYDQQMAVAGRDGFSVWDWGTGAKLLGCQCGASTVPVSSGAGSAVTPGSMGSGFSGLSASGGGGSSTSSSGTNGGRSSSPSRNSRVTALEWVNGFDVSMILAGLDDGSCKLYKSNSGAKEMSLVTAWQAYNNMASTASSVSASSGKITNNVNTNVGLLLTWEQYTQTVVTAGAAQSLRFWDAAREMRTLELPTGAPPDCAVTCLDSVYASVAHDRLEQLATPQHQQHKGIEHPREDGGLVMRPMGGHSIHTTNDDDDNDNVDGSHTSPTQPSSHHTWSGREFAGLVVAGMEDGAVRVFDRRCAPAEARIRKWTEHNARVLAVQLKGHRVVSGSTNGDVKIFDIRKNGVLSSTQALSLQNMTALAIHRNADIYACGSANQTISIHTLAGHQLNMIRFYEGFMNYRISPVSCLAFHPHKVALGAGTAECSVSVYTLDHHHHHHHQSQQSGGGGGGIASVVGGAVQQHLHRR